MENEPIFISLSPEVQELLADNQVDLAEELEKTIPGIKKDFRPDPSVGDHNRTRDVTLVILASAAAFTLVSAGIAKIINALGERNPPRVKKTSLVPVVDNNGNVVHDKDGKPILHWQEVEEIVETKNKVEETSKAEISFLGLKVSLGSDRKKL